MGAKIRAQSAREAANKALREADRAEAEAWSIRMEGYGGPAQPSPTIGQCLNGGLGWLVARWTGHPMIFPIGMLIGLALGVAGVIYRYGRS